MMRQADGDSLGKVDAQKTLVASGIGPPVIPLRIVRKLESVWGTARTFNAAELLWHDVLTERERERLGNVFPHPIMNAIGMWKYVRGGTDLQAAVAVNISFGSLTRETGLSILKWYGESPRLDEANLQVAIAAGGVVLVAGRRHLYWKGEKVAIDWSRHDRAWDFLFGIARAAKLHTRFDGVAFVGEFQAKMPSMRSIKSRLVNLEGFPNAIANCIEHTGHKGEYRLELPVKTGLHLYEPEDGDRLMELGATY